MQIRRHHWEPALPARAEWRRVDRELRHPIYHLFVEQAKGLEPRFLSMVIPSRWMAGGRGLGEFRQGCLPTGASVQLVDYPTQATCSQASGSLAASATSCGTRRS